MVHCVMSMLSCQSHILPVDETSPTPDMDQVQASRHPVSISMISIRLIPEIFKDKSDYSDSPFAVDWTKKEGRIN